MKRTINFENEEKYITLNKDISTIVNNEFSNFTLKLKQTGHLFIHGKFEMNKVPRQNPTYSGYLDPNYNLLFYKKDTWKNTILLLNSGFQILQEIADYSNQEIIHDAIFGPNIGKEWKKSVLKIFLQNGYEYEKRHFLKTYIPNP